LREETGPVTIRVRVFYSDGGRWKNGWMLEGLVLEPILKAKEVPAEKSKGTLEMMA